MVAERKPRRDAHAGEYLSRAAPCGHPGICGCSVAQCCTGCPLARCQYDGGPSLIQLRSSERQVAIVSALQRGVAVNAIVEALGVSRRTVFRLAQGFERGGRRRVSNVTSATPR